MNNIILRGTIDNIKYSHSIGDIEYNKATLRVKRVDNKEDLLNLKFKKFSNPYKNGDTVSLVGNIRTYSQKLQDKNKVDVYIFTYFDLPNEIEDTNFADIEGRICKSNGLRKTSTGKDVIDFILANNLVTDNQSLNCYIPCVAWGKLAKYIAKLNIGDSIHIQGQLHSREYKKKINEDDFEIKVAHEININNIVS